jgi:ribose transport system permease protein
VRLSGVPTGLYVFLVYAISGRFAAVPSLIAVARTGMGAPNGGVGAVLQAIDAVVIGSASLMVGGSIPCSAPFRSPSSAVL